MKEPMRTQPEASHYINGAALDDTSGQSFDSINPASGEAIASLHGATPKVIDAAVAAARGAQPEWAAMPPAERGRILKNAAALMRQRNRELSILETLDTGKPLQETLVADAASGADCLDYFGTVAPTIHGELIDLDGPYIYTRREPLGVCAGIGAWNYPIQIASWKAAPALACGNTVVFKPSEVTPLSALKLAEIFTEAGLPHGVFNVVQGFGDVGAALAGHSDIAKISVTGSVPTGLKVMAKAAESLKHATLELGGKSPLIVLEDADVDNAVSAAMLANFYSAGQICSNGTRVFVHESVRDDFLARLVARTRRIQIGDPLDESTQMGPLISRAHRDKVMDFVDTGRAEGAKLLCGGTTFAPQGFADGAFMEPTIFAGVTDAMRIAREEIFGPVMSVLDFTNEDEVIERANATPFGLAAGVFTRDIERGHRVIAALQAGTCWLNAYNLTPAGMPFGGYKRSGIGRENGRAAIEHYTQLKSVYVETGGVASPY